MDTVRVILHKQHVTCRLSIGNGAGSSTWQVGGRQPPYQSEIWYTKQIKFGQLILRKIIKIVATRCQISDFKAKSISTGTPLPRPPIAGIKGPTSKGRGGLQIYGRGREEGKGRGGGRRREGRKGKAEREVKGETRHTNASLLPAPLRLALKSVTLSEPERRQRLASFDRRRALFLR